MGELSRRSGVPIPTIKFYLREGLLPPGVATAANQADYDEEHLLHFAPVLHLANEHEPTVESGADGPS